jgi:hypothetical protein
MDNKQSRHAPRSLFPAGMCMALAFRDPDEMVERALLGHAPKPTWSRAIRWEFLWSSLGPDAVELFVPQ